MCTLPAQLGSPQIKPSASEIMSTYNQAMLRRVIGEAFELELHVLVVSLSWHLTFMEHSLVKFGVGSVVLRHFLRNAD